jgi:curved DNA-binding protein
MSKLNYYQVLGLNQSATFDEVRRAYRILARRYHPDLNPGKQSEERFKQISLAYQVLSDTDKKRIYDTELESEKRIRAGFAAYERAKNQKFATRSHSDGSRRPSNSKSQPRQSNAGPTENFSLLKDSFAGISQTLSLLRNKLGKPRKSSQAATPERSEVQAQSVSVVEVSVSLNDALFGGRKSIEIPSEANRNKKVSLRIPAGIRTGSVLRMRSSTLSKEEFVFILRLSPHPFIEVTQRGVIIDLPITVKEALLGATLKVPGLQGEETISVSPGSQSGQEVRLTQKGVFYDDGKRGDLFYRLSIQLPTSFQAVGLADKVGAVEQYYESPVRQNLPSSLKSAV